MHIFQPLVRSFSILCLLAVLYSVPLRASSIIDLGSLGGDYVIASDINNKGQIVGWSTIARQGFVRHPFLYSGGQMTDLLPGDKREGYAYGINDAGQIVGSVPFSRTGTPFHAALYTGGKWVDILQHISNAGAAYGINDAGDVVGVDAHQRPFLYSRGQVTYFAGPYGGTATAINNRGQIVGSSDFGSFYPREHAFLYTAGHLMDLQGIPIPDYVSSQASSINNAGDLVGTIFDPSSYGEPPVGFLYANGKLSYIGYTADDINDSGEIVGAADLETFKYCSSRRCAEAFLYSDGVMTNLNSFLPEGSDWELDEATAINDKGQIVGIGIRPVGPDRDLLQFAFLLDTTPEPATLLLMGVGLVGLALMQRKLMRRTKMRQ